MAKVLCVLYDDPVTGYPPDYARGGVPSIASYPDGQSAPTPDTINFTLGELLGSVSGEFGLRRFLEDRGHELVVTADKDGQDSEFERELPGAEVVISQLARSRTAAHREVQRARVLLMAADGRPNTAIALTAGVSPATVKSWRERFASEGLKGLGGVRPGRGRKPQISQEKLVDVVGLYLNPPERAVVLCMDEKSQIQALDRTQPSLPMKKGRAGTMTHDYKRNGTTTLFAALDVLTGAVIGECMPRHRHEEFLKFLRVIDREVPEGLQIHLILDNYSTHKHADVKKWPAKHPRFVLHFIPTSSSWLNMVERFFGKLEDKATRRGIFNSVPDLIAAIDAYLAATNEDPKPFVWTATAEQILTKVRRGRVALDAITN